MVLVFIQARYYQRVIPTEHSEQDIITLCGNPDTLSPPRQAAQCQTKGSKQARAGQLEAKPQQNLGA